MSDSKLKFTPPTVTDDLSALEKVKQWMEMAAQYDENHDTELRSLMHLESAVFSPTPANPHAATVVWSLTIPSSMCNMAANLHGGAVALIFDICTSTAIMAASSPGFWDMGHVSRTLNCTYLRPAPVGSKVIIESQVVHLGKRLGMTTGVIRGEDGKVCYTCEHQKAVVGVPVL